MSEETTTEMQIRMADDLFTDIAEGKIQGVCIAVIYKDKSFRIGWSGEASHLEKLGLFEQAKEDIAHTCHEEKES